MSAIELRGRARRAYEWGRWKEGMLRAWPVLLIAGIAFVWRGSLTHTLTVAAVLGGIVSALAWRGGVLGRAIEPGLLAGVLPLGLPLLIAGASSDSCPAMGTDCVPYDACLMACVGGGILAGLVVGFASWQVSTNRAPFVLAAGALAALTGALGCTLIGVAGLAGMVAGFAVSGIPLLALAPHRSPSP